MHRHPDSGSRRGGVPATVIGVGIVVVAAVVWLGSGDGDAGPSGTSSVEETGSVDTTSVTETTTPPSTPTRTTVARLEEGSTDDPSSAADSPSPTEPETTTTLPQRICEQAPPSPAGTEPPVLVDLQGDDPAAVAISISGLLHTCADDVVVAHPLDLYSATIAAQLAARLFSPLLYYRPSSEAALAAELRRLGPRRVWLMEEMPDSLGPPGAEIIRMPAGAEELIEWISFQEPTVVIGASPVSGHTALLSLVVTGDGLGMILAPLNRATDEPVREPVPVIGSAARALRSPRLWLVDPERPAAGLAVAAAVAALGERAIYWDPEGMGWNEANRLLDAQAEGMEEVWIARDLSESGRWLLETTLLGEELPGGGHILFPDRRLVAFYGATSSGVLGVLGEQEPEESLERMAPFLEDYAADGIMTVPTFEIITTLATAAPGGDGDYSGEFKIDTLMPWVEFAARNGVYVVLDLQPGRSNFLSQAKQYEELLRLPHVGLALDPEWRLGPNEVHLVQIGSVDGWEANSVIEWLSALVREERLPQKLLIVHQFRVDMIPNRGLLSTPPELAVMIHMDGQGALATKYNTWGILVAGTEDREWWWGWKNFFDEDFPLATPEQVLDLRPTVYFVSFQ